MASIPTTSQMESIITRIVKKTNPADITVGQVRATVKAKILEKEGVSEDAYDFDSKEFKTVTKELLIKVLSDQELEKKKSSSQKRGRDDEEEKKEDSDDDEGDDDEERKPKKKKSKKSKEEKKKRSSNSSVGSTGSSSSSSKKEAAAPPVEDDPRLKALKRMAQAMAAAPGVYKGFKDMDQEEKISVLRERLKEKGAKFKGSVPTKEEIKEAEEATMLKKDLEGIDTSNIVQAGSRRRAAVEGAYGVVGDDGSGKKKKKVEGGSSSSSSEDELDL